MKNVWMYTRGVAFICISWFVLIAILKTIWRIISVTWNLIPW